MRGNFLSYYVSECMILFLIRFAVSQVRRTNKKAPNPSAGSGATILLTQAVRDLAASLGGGTFAFIGIGRRRMASARSANHQLEREYNPVAFVRELAPRDPFK